MVVTYLAKMDVIVYISLIVDKVELDEQGNIVTIDEQPFDEFIQDTYGSIDNEDVVTIKQKMTEYYTMC